jgi:hypothetical protein
MTMRVGRTFTWLLMSSLAATACGTVKVSVPQEFPVPLVERVPLHMAVRLDPELVQYAHTEKIEGGREWHIELGSAQRPMFERLLTGMFERAHVLDADARLNGSAAGVLVPSIQEVQFSTPDQTRTDFFEVWIRYRFELYDADGTFVAEWPLTAYGQSNVRNFGMQGQQPALQAAALAACRDAMAFFIIQFRNIPAVQSWLAGKTGGAPS